MTRTAAYNSTYKKVAVQWLNQAFTSSKVSTWATLSISKSPSSFSCKTLQKNIKIKTMLDFYIIQDDQVKPNSPEKLGLEFVGGLDEKIVENLQNKEIIDKWFYLNIL